MADRRLLKEHFYESFVKLSAKAWQLMSFFNFPLYKSMGTLSCHSNQTKELNFIQKQEAHGPWLAHLSETATVDMQMLYNIFSILSLQLIKGSSVL